MFDVKQSEKEIALSIFKREIGVKKLDMDGVAEKINISHDMLKEIFRNNGEFYAFHTLIFWAEIIASSCSADDILSRKLDRKSSKPPHDAFYHEVWRFISSMEPEEKNENSINIENKD